MACNQRDVFGTLPKRWHVNGQYVEPEIQIFPKALIGDFGLEIPVGGCENAQIDPSWGVGADGADLTVLEDPQKLGLDTCRNVADFIEQDGATVGCDEQAFADSIRSGEGAPDMLEQLAFQ